MELKVIDKNYKARNVERAVEALMYMCLQSLYIKGEVLKFTNSENIGSREIKWNMHFKTKEDAERVAETLSIPCIDVSYYGEFNGDYLVVAILTWCPESAEEQLKIENSIVIEIEEILGITINKGVEDINILKGEYHQGNVEIIIFE